jgi:prophage DNA circulation protein
LFKADAQEAIPICDAVLVALLAQAPASGLPGADLRLAANSFRVNAEAILMADAAGAPLANIFQLSQANGISLPQMEYVRNVAVSQPAVSAGAILIRDSLVQFALITEGSIIGAMTFTSRDDVEATRATINAAFAPSEEAAADSMDSTTYMALITLHAAIGYFLTLTAQPLPQMLSFVFATPLPTLVASYKLYSDASYADQLRAENKCIHPAFLQPTGRALAPSS